MSFRQIPTSMVRDPAWLGLSGDARALFITLRLILGRPAFGTAWPQQLEALAPESDPSLAELVGAGVLEVETLATGELVIWLRRWALDTERVRGSKTATGLLRAVADHPRCGLLTAWYEHYRPMLETSSDWPAVAATLPDGASDGSSDGSSMGNPSRAGEMRAGERERETERERHLSRSLSPAHPTSPDSGEVAAADPGGPPPPRASRARRAGVNSSPDEPQASAGADGAQASPEAARTTLSTEDEAGADSPARGKVDVQALAAAGIAVPKSRLVPDGPPTNMTREEQIAWAKAQRTEDRNQKAVA